ncbi:uncharacterized protein LOC128893052 [Hylaeus anthracinus]|uniref:uncharacterized protein LOC128893052 n=1 Tax=Hylaeus anthracinus TaxID=313031 RepID=UPI0023B92D56|nr:uncharacterized protein LOC128893052 [Hylaeus anthracinus]
MENEQATVSESSTICSINSESFHNIDNRCGELSDDEHCEKDNTNSDLVLDLRDVNPYCEPVSENESLEKLSAVIEQPEESSVILEDARSSRDDREDRDIILRDRIESLRELMRNLKDELKREVELWRKEREELQLLREKENAMALEEATAAARAAAAAYAVESPLSNNLDLTSEDTIRELTILEYEKRLAKYQDEYSFSQAEKRYNTRWKMIASAYKQKLIEVERLCNEELEKVQQNASHLQPLKEMASQWYTDEKNHGDTIRRSEFGASVEKSAILNEESARGNKFQSIDAEVNMAPEIFVARFKSENLAKNDRYYPQF